MNPANASEREVASLRKLAVPATNASAPYVGFVSEVGRQRGEPKNSAKSSLWVIKPNPSREMKIKIKMKSEERGEPDPAPDPQLKTPAHSRSTSIAAPERLRPAATSRAGATTTCAGSCSTPTTGRA